MPGALHGSGAEETRIGSLGGLDEATEGGHGVGHVEDLESTLLLRVALRQERTARTAHRRTGQYDGDHVRGKCTPLLLCVRHCHAKGMGQGGQAQAGQIPRTIPGNGEGMLPVDASKEVEGRNLAPTHAVLAL